MTKFKKKNDLDVGLSDGDLCDVIEGTHKGKSGTVRDINTSKTGQITITVVQANGERFKTLARNVIIT
jgi:ribosomal protein S4E